MSSVDVSDPEKAKHYLLKNNIDTIKLGMVDIDGLWRGKRVTVDYFFDSIISNGANIADILFGWDIADKLIPGLAFTSWQTGYPDIFMVPDLSTLAIVPWEDRTASFICDVVDVHGDPVKVSPRQVLKKVLDGMSKDDLTVAVGYELEFYLLRETARSLEEKKYSGLDALTHGIHTYSLYRGAGTEFIIGDIRRKMNEYGVVVDAANSEYGPGQFEVNLRYCPAMTAADRSLLYKNGIKEIAASHDLMATFIAKLDVANAGSSGHVHQSVADANGKNLFSDGEGGLSDMAKHYLAGVLTTLPEFTAFFCPTVNSYKRTVEESWAGVSATWATDNRTTALRAIVSSTSATRIENRLPGADANPHIVIAACVAAGRHGIAEKLEPPEPTVGNAYDIPEELAPRLPRSLEHAVELLDKSKVARDFLGSDFVDHFVATRRWEIREYGTAVTDWERRRYIEMV